MWTALVIVLSVVALALIAEVVRRAVSGRAMEDDFRRAAERSVVIGGSRGAGPDHGLDRRAAA